MARIIGVEIPNEKKIKISLRYIYGIGPTTAMTILKATNIDPEKKTKDLVDVEIKRLYDYIEGNVPTEGQVKQKRFQAIKRLKEIRAFRGLRHKNNLPTRGQNTRSNARTRKGKSIAVGGLKIKATKT